MKSIFLISALLLSTFQAYAMDYRCECVDTGVECDGMENMNVFLEGKKATITIGSEDWKMTDSFVTKLNAKYSPREKEHMNFSQFKITSSGGGYNFDLKKSTFLIEKELVEGGKSGTVKFQSVSDKSVGGGFWSWVFECRLD